jgi:hypothetical protein
MRSIAVRRATGNAQVTLPIGARQYRQQMAARRTATDDQIRAILSTAPLPGEEGLL